ncbi:MAG: lysine--tRNA ligase [Candidatus Roizmanbacteria bacterium]
MTDTLPSDLTASQAPVAHADDFIGQRTRRINNLQELKRLGISCYPAQSKKDASNAIVHAEFDKRKGSQITLAGRVMKWRAMGKLIFADIEDATGRMQICIRRDVYPPETNMPRTTQILSWAELKYLDLGDFIQVAGILDKTQAGEVTLFASEIILLSKSIRPYPNKMDDKDERYRRRYVDMVLHPSVREIIRRKAIFWQSIRNVLVDKGFTEVFLPVLEHTTGGADAKPFVTHHNTLDEDLYLRISLELYSKRAIGAGFEKVFAIGPVFRNEGMSDEHANEFNHIEWYWAYADYQDQMKLTREVMIAAAQAVYGKTTFVTRGHTFDLSDEWKQIDYASIIKERLGVDIFNTPDADLQKILIEHKVELGDGAINRQRMIDNLWKLIRKTISGPAFLVNEPAFMSPLAKAKTDDPRLTERFHVVIAGTELANGYSEINDPIYQLEQFRSQESMRESGDDEAQMLDIDFVEMLEYGMPPTTGLGFSERLFWFLEDITAREGAMFPILRNDTDSLTKKIYPFLSSKAKAPKQMAINPAGSSVSHTTNQPVQIGITREQAWTLVTGHIKNQNLQKHCLAVEAAMRALAAHHHADEALWSVVGLLHDADWEECREIPNQHTLKTIEWLKSMGVHNNDLIDAILTHAHHVTGFRLPETPLEWSLFCCDELTGLIVASTLVLPTKKIADLTVESVIKKMGSKSFAAAIDREGIKLCTAKLGIELQEFIDIVLMGMKKSASDLGL